MKRLVTSGLIRLPLYFYFLTETPICNNECVKIQKWIHVRKSGVQGLNIILKLKKGLRKVAVKAIVHTCVEDD